MRRHLFTVTRAGRPVAVVLAHEFVDAVALAFRLIAVGPTSAHERPTLAPMPIGEMRARRPTAGERRLIAVAALRLRGEMTLTALPL